MPLIVSRLNVSDEIYARAVAALDARYPPLNDPPETPQQRYNRFVRTHLRDLIRRVEQEAASAAVLPPPAEEFVDA